MWFWLIPLVIFIIALLAVLFVLWRKMPVVRAIDISAIPTERAKKIKEDIIMQRFQRMSSEKLGGVAKAGFSAWTSVSKMGRRAVQKLYKMEQYYQKLKHAPENGVHALDVESTKRMLDEAEALVREEEFIPAEKRYIEVISHNPKMVDAYEGLGNLYLKNKQYAQARETLGFTLRLSPDDASVHMSLAELETAEDNLKKAVEHLRECIRIRPNNPKYLDTYIETAFVAGMLEDAQKGVARMKEANPENQKIEEWEERLKEK